LKPVILSAAKNLTRRGKPLFARGNFTVDLHWKDGQATNYRITSLEPREVKVRVNGETKTIQAEKQP